MARILIIDDNAPTRDILRQALERAGHEVMEAPDGRIGLVHQRAMPAEVIITDILMPLVSHNFAHVCQGGVHQRASGATPLSVDGHEQLLDRWALRPGLCWKKYTRRH
jgi:CheY-like chemotaxis protein